MLVICTRSGLYEWLRMPFGPSPAPAHMQSYVQQTFGVLRDKDHGTPYCTPLMDDICVSSASFEKHMEHLNELCRKARQRGFEFKFLKGQFNKAELELWGCVCGKHGRRAMPKKIDQLENWPEPTTCQQLNSFLCFVNYLAEYMDPDWVKHQAVLAPLRKKDADFAVWSKDPKYRNAFLEVRKGLSRNAMLVHPDFEAAARPDLTGRPFENFIDASDFGWAAVLTQRPSPHAAPKIIAMIAKAFTDTQLRWSAMEREFFALWQGVTGHERLIKGFKCYCYIDHRNNLFNEALLENRRIAKKMSNWALELQAFNIVRIWIRGEANILADAPSRAPWENVLAEHLPIPQGPLREVIKTMYRMPEEFESEVQSVVKKKGLDVSVWKGLDRAQQDGDPDTVLSDYSYASSGRRRGSVQSDASDATPNFGESNSVLCGAEVLMRWHAEFGSGGVVENSGPIYPRLPTFNMTEEDVNQMRPAGEFSDIPVPVDPRDVPHALQRVTDDQGDSYVVRWPRKVKFTSGELSASRWISCKRYGAEEAKELAWAYFSARYRGMLVDRDPFDMSEAALRGPLGAPTEEGKRYHGDRDRRFTVWSFGKPLVGTFKVATWNPWSDTCDTPEEFCGHFRPCGLDSHGNQICECLGHEPEVGPDASVGAHPLFAADTVTAGVPKDEETDLGSGVSTDLAVSDSWDLVLREQRYVRTHERPRTTLFSPGLEGLDEPGAPTVRLSGERVSVMFFSNGDVNVHVDVWPASANEFDTGGRGPWTGSTHFVPEGMKFRSYVLEPRTHKPRPRAELLSDLDLGVKRDDLFEGTLSIANIERERLISDQMVCPELGPIYHAVLARQRGSEVEWNKLKRIAPEIFRNNVAADTVKRQSEKFEIHDGLLYRRVFDATEGEIQLKPCVPTGVASAVELPGYGQRGLDHRSRLMLEYHNGVLGGHMGRDSTMDRLERDWWWPGMYRDVCDWCKHCEICQREHSRSGASAHTRTQLFTRPFQVIEFDLVTCRDVSRNEGVEGSVTGAKYILTAICCFSKFPWMVPIPDKSARTVAKALLERVLLNLAMFPTVLRSDNDPDFTSNVVVCLNRMLNIKHVFGSVYHPQSQGQVENLHRTMTQVLRKLLQSKPNEWEEMIPYCECLLRVTPLQSLGGRSPYQVVTGLIPRLPRAVMADQASGAVSVDDYADRLVSYLQSAYKDIYRRQAGDREEQEFEDEQRGRISAELQVGDVVVVKLPPTQSRTGPKRFTARTRAQMWRVYKKAGPNTVWLEDANDRSIKNPYSHNASNLIKLNLPNLELEATRSGYLETYDNTTGEWTLHKVERHSIDGRTLLRRTTRDLDGVLVDDPNPVWVDLAEEVYRWIV